MSSPAEIVVRPTPEQATAWTTAAGEMPVDEWLAELADAATLDRPRTWPVLVKLQQPIDFGSERIDALEFRRGRMGDLKGMKVDGIPPADQLLLLASRMCGKPVKALEMLDDEDGAEVLALALGFFGTCLMGGRRSSR